MTDVDKDGFFMFLRESKKWNYSDAEQEVMWKGFPDYIGYEQLKSAILMNTKKTQPIPKKIVQLAWDEVKKNKGIKRKRESAYEGCNNCEYGFIKFPKISQHKIERYKYNLINLSELLSYPLTKIHCPCTGKNDYIDAFTNLKNLLFENPKLYEICYLTLYAYCKYHINPERFINFDDFNPYRIYSYVDYEECHILKFSDLKYFPHIINHTGNKPRPATVMPELSLKRIPTTYNKKIY